MWLRTITYPSAKRTAGTWKSPQWKGDRDHLQNLRFWEHFSVGGVPWLGTLIILMTKAPSPRMVKFNLQVVIWYHVRIPKKMHNNGREIHQNYHTFAFFDCPQKGSQLTWSHPSCIRYPQLELIYGWPLFLDLALTDKKRCSACLEDECEVEQKIEADFFAMKQS